MPIPADVIKCYKYLDLRIKNHIEELRQIVEIPNVSADPNAQGHLTTLVSWLSRRLKNLGFNMVTMSPNYKKTHKGNKPPIVVGTLGKDPKKVTLLYYCHLDVLKVQRERWETDPFKLTELDGRLYGRGTAKMKGPLLCFIHAIEAYRETGVELPVNIRVICESMFECKSRGLTSVLEDLKPVLSQVNCVLMNESRWLGKEYPCLVFGMRGVCYFNLTIEGPKTDLHSGDFGGVVREPMQDLLFLLNSLADPFGHILVPNVYDDVVEVTPDEEALKKKIKLEVEDYRSSVGVDNLGFCGNLKLVLMHVWRYPWFNLHYINSSCENSNLLDIPKKVFARFSVRLVPNQRHEKVSKSLLSYVEGLKQQLKSPNKIEITSEMPLDPWLEDHMHWNYEAANTATKQVYKEEASFIREGNGFPTLLKLREAMPKVNILMLPIVDSESKVHTEEENISIGCYIEGAKVIASYFYALNDARARSLARKKYKRQDVCRDTL